MIIFLDLREILSRQILGMFFDPEYASKPGQTIKQNLGISGIYQIKSHLYRDLAYPYQSNYAVLSDDPDQKTLSWLQQVENM